MMLITMKITSKHLEIAVLPKNSIPNEKKILYVKSKHENSPALNIFQIEENTHEFVGYLATEIDSASSLPEMSQLLDEFSTYLTVSCAEDGYNQGVNLKTMMTLTKSIHCLALQWFNQAHKLVYGVGIPGVKQYIENNRHSVS